MNKGELLSTSCMPITLTLVRHGESESNLARTMFEAGKKHKNEAALMEIHTCDRRLTPKGVEQAKLAGKWLDANVFSQNNYSQVSDFRLYVSPYIRARETAGHLSLPGEWRLENRIVERNWGDFDQMPYDKRMSMYADEIKYRKEFAFFWCPPGGERMQDVFNRLRDMASTLHRECSDMSVLMVSHGETMWAWRTLLEYWTPQELAENMKQRDSHTRITNCRIIQYTRRLPDGSVSKHFEQVRFVDPTRDGSEFGTDWMPIVRKRYSSEELLAQADQYPRFFDEESDAA